eukprot:gnl/TRDRNA2_/TRDRNA2_137066_c0_seq4.p1 gnl/TRDRNA2_/TRDRNA2_137066_c0~~gnl/TRDRNA2_/TRDRNA2_137066_c0_seq4.p1  ORF type:complete len:557 (-),score=112.25 gnl/TRDRNA2_/TRDRNA2_137066_c0_seq4:241-1911(-)
MTTPGTSLNGNKNDSAAAPGTPLQGKAGSPVLGPTGTAPPGAHSTPKLGPAAASRPRAGSVSGGPWQLVEVGAVSAAVVRSPHTSPKFTFASSKGKGLSPSMSPNFAVAAEPPELPPLEDLPAAEEAERQTEELVADNGEAAESKTATQAGEDATGKEVDEEPEASKSFNPSYFVGEWLDNLGHVIYVTPKQWPRGKRLPRAAHRQTFLAVLTRAGQPDKRFTINRDRTTREWSCGNGLLDWPECSWETVTWRTSDDRVSKWTRAPPQGPVYFDAPPPHPALIPMSMMEANKGAGFEENPDGPPWMQYGDGSQVVVWVDEYGMQQHMGGEIHMDCREWKELRLPVDEDEQEADPDAAETRAARAARMAEMMGPAAVSPSMTSTEKLHGKELNASAPEFVPSMPVPATQEQEKKPPPAVEEAVLTLAEESPDVRVRGRRLEWSLPDAWEKLTKFPKDFCLTSPVFGFNQTHNMQLMFYPNGNRAAEPGNCTLALSRGPDTAGIKFEFSVNERGSGPKVCLGRRYVGDYPKPFDDSDGSKSKHVIVHLKVLEILGTAN